MKYTTTAKFSMALGILLIAMSLIGRAQTVIYSDSFESDALNTTHPAGWSDVATGVSPGGGYVHITGTSTYAGTYSGLDGVHAAYMYLQGLSGQTATSQGNDFYNPNIGQTFAANTTYKLTYLYGEYGGGPTTISFMGNDSVILSTQQTITGGSTAFVSGPTITIDTATNPGLVGQAIGIDINWAPYTGQYFRSVGIDNVQVTATADIAIGKGSMGINLGGNEFVDLIKNVKQGIFDKIGHPKDANGNYIPANVDANGWPSEDAVAGFFGNGHIDSLNDAQPVEIGGTYHISFQCATSNPTISGYPFALTVSHFTAVADGTGQYLINADIYLAPVAPSPTGSSTNSFGVQITNTTAGSIAGARNIRIIPPGYAANTTQVFRTDYLNLLQPFSVMRAMDLSSTNASPTYPAVTAWTDRTLPTFGTTSGTTKPNGGLPWEYLIQLANSTNKDLWINVPIAATDDYVTKLAQLFKYGSDASGNVYTSTQANPVYPPLNANLHLYVEYSNEIWNNFPQGTWNRLAAQNEYTNGTSPVTASANLKPLGSSVYTYNSSPGPANRVAERLVQISNIFSGVWGAGAINTSIRPVYAWQLGGSDEAQCAWIQLNYGAPKNYIYGLAAAPYLGTTATQSNTSTGLTPAACIADMESTITSDHPYLINLRAGATYYGLKDLTYEGGVGMTGTGDFQAKYDSQYLVGINGGQDGVDTVLTKYYNDYFTTEGGDLNLYYSQSGFWSKYGFWGLVEWNSDLATSARALPKWNAINTVSNAALPASTAGTSVPTAGVRFNEADYLIALDSLTSAQYGSHGIYNSTDPTPVHFFELFGPNLPTDAPAVFEYLVNITTAGTYNIKQSCASTNAQTMTVGDPSSGPATIQLYVDNQAQPVVTVPTTTTVNSQFVDVTLGTLALTKGLHTVHINVIHAATSSHLHALGLCQLVITP